MYMLVIFMWAYIYIYLCGLFKEVGAKKCMLTLNCILFLTCVFLQKVTLLLVRDDGVIYRTGHTYVPCDRN